MEKLTDKYYLGSNKNTFILYERRISQTTGKESFKNLGYYPRLDSLYNGLIELEIKKDLTILQNIEKIEELVAKLKEFTVEYISKNQDENKE